MAPVQLNSGELYPLPIKNSNGQQPCAGLPQFPGDARPGDSTRLAAHMACLQALDLALVQHYLQGPLCAHTGGSAASQPCQQHAEPFSRRCTSALPARRPGVTWQRPSTMKHSCAAATPASSPRKATSSAAQRRGSSQVGCSGSGGAGCRGPVCTEACHSSAYGMVGPTAGGNGCELAGWAAWQPAALTGSAAPCWWHPVCPFLASLSSLWEPTCCSYVKGWNPLIQEAAARQGKLTCRKQSGQDSK